MALALRNAAPLKPEIQLAQAVSVFEASLVADQKSKFRVYHGQSPPDVNDVMRLTAQIDKENSRRKSRRCVGPRLTNVLQSVQQFSTVVDIVSGYSSYFENLSTLFMNLGRTCPRYQEFGLLYTDSLGLQKALCEYFVVVVKLCHQSVLFTRKPFFSQFSSSLLQPFNSEFGPFEVDLRRLGGVISEEILLASNRAQCQETRESSGFRALATKFSERKLWELQRARESRARKTLSKFLNACSTYNHDTAWKQARKHGNTKWFCEKEEYKQWRDLPSSSLLWLTGSLGSGKTVLSSNLAEELIVTTQNADVSYFFCQHDNAESLRTRSIIGSIARQLFSHSELELIRTDMPFAVISLDTDQILTYIENLLPTNHKQHFIVIDGLDECAEKEIRMLMECLRQLLTSKHVFHIYCSSRPDVSRWAPAFSGSQWNLTMSEAGSDIARYIENELTQRIESNNLCLGDGNIVFDIQDALMEGSQGMFLWVAFQLNSICSQENDEDILNALQDLPKDLPETYNRILRRLHQSGHNNAELGKRIFEIVAAAQRPLDLAELRDAINVIPGDTIWHARKLSNDMRRTLDCCGSLLVIDEEFSTVQFAHHSVKQHLLSNPPDQIVNQYSVCASDADIHLGEICVTYLSLEVLGTQLEKTGPAAKTNLADLPSAILTSTLPQLNIASRLALRLLKTREPIRNVHSHVDKVVRLAQESNELQVQQELSFLSYAKEYWLFHSKRFEPLSEALGNLWVKLLDTRMCLLDVPWVRNDGQEWRSLASMQWMMNNDHGPLLYWTLSHLSVHLSDDPSQTPSFDLETASNDQESFRDMIIEKLRLTNIPLKYYGGAMHVAVAWGNFGMIRLLIEKGVDIDEQNNFGTAPRRGNSAMVKVLLGLGANPNLCWSFQETPLQLAASKGYSDIVRLLLPAGANPNATNGNFPSALLQACQGLHKEVVELLLLRGANINEVNKEGIHALYIASQLDCPSLVEILLRNGADPDQAGGNSALHAALENRNLEMMKLLLRFGANVEAESPSGKRALYSATKRYDIQAVKLLLESRADVNVQGGHYGNALQAASSFNFVTLVQLFLRFGADVTQVNVNGKTALDLAREMKHEKIVDIFMDHERVRLARMASENLNRTYIS